MKRQHIEAIVILFAWSAALAGPLKYASSILGAPLYLVPKVLLVLVAIAVLLLVKARPSQVLVAICAVLIVYIASSNRIAIPQALFGVWAIVPFLFGLMFPESVLSKRVSRAFFALCVVSALGEFVSYLVVFPWSGMDLDVGGVTTRGSREWSDGESRRLAGFSTSSIDLSLIFAVTGIYYAFQPRRPLTRLLLALPFTFLIVLTTMKTAALAYVVAIAPLILPLKTLRIFAAGIGASAAILGALIPFTLRSDTFGVVHWARSSHLSSFQDRVLNTWPGVITYIDNSHVGLFGLGAGGLGSALQRGGWIFQYAATDNMYLYLIGIGGVLGIVLIALLIVRLTRLAFATSSAAEPYTLPLLIFFAIYGCTQPIIETSLSALFFGALLARSPSARFRNDLPQRADASRARPSLQNRPELPECL